MDAQQATEFAAASAREAIDQQDAYTDAYGSYRDNVIDTLNDCGASEYVVIALGEFDRIAKAIKK